MKTLVLALVAMFAITACDPAVWEALSPQQQADIFADAKRKDSAASAAHSKQMHPTLVCIRRHESDRGPYPHTNGYGAQNSRSSASGAYQFIDGTWRTMSARAGHGGYSRAKYAPSWVQDAVAYHTAVLNGGISHWAGSGC